MKKRHILYNPLAGAGSCLEDARLLDVIYDTSEYRDITKIENYEEYFSSLAPSDEIIICGGDGTLSRFANATRNINISNPIYYFACGSGNDFVRDLGLAKNADPDFRVNDYLQPLPSVTVNGENRLFLNNVGFGIDGYCCGERERLREQYRLKGSKKDVNYTAIWIKSLFGSYKPCNATVTVDGVSHFFQNVWLAPTMHGRYYGGGMMAAPEQDRLAATKSLSLMVMHGAGRIHALCIFPSIFKGKHLRHKKYVSLLCGQNIKVEFDKPATLQIDGECIPDVMAYEAKTAVRLSVKGADEI